MFISGLNILPDDNRQWQRVYNHYDKVIVKKKTLPTDLSSFCAVSQYKGQSDRPIVRCIRLLLIWKFYQNHRHRYSRRCRCRRHCHHHHHLLLLLVLLVLVLVAVIILPVHRHHHTIPINKLERQGPAAYVPLVTIVCSPVAWYGRAR